MTELPRTIAAVLLRHAETRGRQRALGFRENGRWTSWSFAQYLEEATRAAAGLRAAGVAGGDHVLALVVEPEAAAALILGAWIVGAVPIQVGIPYRLTDTAAFVRELGDMATRLRSRFLVVSEQFAAGATVDGVHVVTASEVRSERHGIVKYSPSDRSHDVALVQLTSGSTGHPRGVVIGHDELVLHMDSMSRALPVAREGMVGVSWLPLHHDMGLIGGLLFPLYNGFPVQVLSPLDFRARPFAWLEAMSEFEAGITAAPPSAYSLVARLAGRAEEAKLDLSRWECAMIGAEPISPRLIRSFSAAFAPCGFRPEAFFPVYGLAEATVAVTFPPLLAPTRFDAVSRSALERDGRAVPTDDERDRIEWTGVGSAIPNSEIRIVDGDGNELGERTVGEILVASKTLFCGYFDEPAATREAIVDGFLRTGDLGYVADGRLFVTGRKKELIISGGRNVVPSVIEDVVSAVDGIRPGCVAAVGLYSAALETEEIWVVAETKLGAEEHRALSHRVRDALRIRGISIDHVRFLAPGTMPKTTSGKVQRGRIRRELDAKASVG